MQKRKTPIITKSELKAVMRVLPFFALYFVLARLICRSACIFKVILGVPCPGCGLTRAFKAALGLRFGEALWWHPLFWSIPVVVIVFLYKRWKFGAGNIRWFTVFMVGATAIFIAVFAVRMVMRFPHTAPFTLNRYSFTLRIVDFIKNLVTR